MVPQVFVFLKTDGLVAPHRLQEAIVRLSPQELVHGEGVGAEVGYLGGEILVMPFTTDHGSKPCHAARSSSPCCTIPNTESTGGSHEGAVDRGEWPARGRLE